MKLRFEYYDIKKTFDEVKDSFSYGDNAEKLSSSAKLLKESVLNTAMLSAEIGVEIVKRIPEYVGKTAEEKLKNNSYSMSEEEIEKMNKLVEIGKEHRKKREDTNN